MNVADSQRVASALERLGYQDTRQAEEADVIILNTCVVRQSAEDKAYGRLQSLRPLKDKRPDLVINLMGCLVGVKGSERLQKRFPFVDVFSPPSDPVPLVAYLSQAESRSLEQSETERRFEWMDEELGGESPGSAPAAARTRPAGFSACAGGVGLLACLHLLYHPLPARGRAQPAGGRHHGRGAFSGRTRRQRGDLLGADCRPLRQGRTRRSEAV